MKKKFWRKDTKSETEKELDEQVENRIMQVDAKLGPTVKILERVRPKRPLREIHYDWLTVMGFAERVRKKILKETSTDIAKEWWWKKKKDRYVTIEAYLTLAKYEKDPGKAWSFVNSADKLLPLVVEDDDIERCTFRFRSWDEKLNKIDKSANAMRDQLVKEYSNKIATQSKKSPIDKNRWELYCEQAARAQVWYSVANGKLSLTYSLYCSIMLRLLVALIPVIIVAEILHAIFLPQNPSWRLPFVAVALMGFFGGGLSVAVKGGQIIKRTTSSALISRIFTTRMIIGASGAIVVYILISSGLLILTSNLINDNFFLFLGVGILGGFSEQFFVKCLEYSAQSLTPLDKPMIDVSPLVKSKG